MSASVSAYESMSVSLCAHVCECESLCVYKSV